MSYARIAARRCSRWSALSGLAWLALAAGIIGARPAAASGRLGVLVGFKQPPLVLSRPVLASILTRSREQARIAALHGRVGRHFRHADAVSVTLPAEAIAALRRDPSVAYVEEDRPVHLLQLLPGSSPPPPAHQLSPELVPWGIAGDDQTAGVRAIDSGADGDGVKVGVIDTGIGPHPDLAVVDGYNFVANVSDYSDDEGHGTHVAGTIAALHNGVGVVGVAPKAQLYALKAMNSHGLGQTSDLVAAIEWAVDHHLQVLNMSYGADKTSETEHRAIVDAATAGIVMVAAAGNNGGAINYPAAYPEVMAVGAADRTGTVAPFSSRGPALGFVAPGVGVLSTVPQLLGYTFAAALQADGTSDLAANGIRYSSSTPPDGIDGPVRFAGRGTTTDVGAVDLKGVVALMERGDITFSEKVKNAAAAGAIGALIYNNVPGSYAATLDGPGAIPALAMTRAQGLALVDSPDQRVRLYVTPNSLYTRFSGTSMATPHVTGTVALILSVNPKLDPAGVRMILKQTATDLGDPGRDDLYGDGLVNATAAVQAARAAAPALAGSSH
jgi:subtilisin family serine protease